MTSERKSQRALCSRCAEASEADSDADADESSTGTATGDALAASASERRLSVCTADVHVATSCENQFHFRQDANIELSESRSLNCELWLL